MRTTAVTLLGAAMMSAAVLTTAGSTHAHATLLVRETEPTTTMLITLQIPHGCGDESTTGIEMTIPEGVVAVRPMAKPGWTITLEEGDYDNTYTYHGREISAGVTAVRWTGGSLPSNFYDQFIVRGHVTDFSDGTRLYFPTRQVCGDRSSDWVQVPAEGQGSSGLEFPAPSLLIMASSDGDSHGHGHDHSHHMAAHGDAAADTSGAPAATVGDVQVHQPWARASARAGGNSAAFVTFVNDGTDDRLVEARATVSQAVELHTHIMDGDVMRMRPVEAIDLPGGDMTVLQPGGLHVMFIGLTEQLVQGDTLSLTLVFETAGEVTVDVPILPIGATSP